MRFQLLLCCFLPLFGCGVLTPKTSVSYGPFGFSFADTKDNDVEIEGLEFNPETKTWKVDRFTLRNNASDPIKENVQQLVQVNEQMKTAGVNLKIAMEGVTNFATALTPIARLFAPGVSASGPLGGKLELSPEGLTALGEILRPLIKEELEKAKASE